MTDQDTDITADDTAADAPDTQPFPWPPHSVEPFVAALGRTWQGASLAPRHFFAVMPYAAPLGPPLLYYLLIGIAASGAELFWSMISNGLGPATTTVLGTTGAWSPLIGFLLSPVLLLFGLFMAAGVTHALLALFSGAGGGFGVTVRVFCYAYSPMILGVIPKVGAYAGTVWMVVIAIIGLREAHRTTTARTAAAVLIPLIALLGLYAMAELLIHAGGLLDLAASSGGD